MVDAILGAVVMVVATSSMLLALQSVQTSVTSRAQLSSDEVKILQIAGFDEDDITEFQIQLNLLPQEYSP